MGYIWKIRESNEREQKHNLLLHYNSRQLWSKEMYKIFREYVNIDAVVMQSKKDKHGKRYGFTRFFFNVTDEKSFALKQENIITASQKSFVND